VVSGNPKPKEQNEQEDRLVADLALALATIARELYAQEQVADKERKS
jgi:hypothetical protein